MGKIGIAVGVLSLALTLGTATIGSLEADAAKKAPVCMGKKATIVLTKSQIGTLVQGTSGNDVVVGTNGNDIFSGDGGRDLVCLGKGQDIFYSWAGGTDLIGDQAYGGKGNDTLVGGAGADRLFGGNGNDNLSGKEGQDRCDGGKGTDKELVPGDCEILTSVEQ